MSHRTNRLRIVAGTASAALVLTGMGLLGGQGAHAADPPLAQSVGRFLDGSAGGEPIQALADVHDARAVNPGSTSAQNPLDVTLLGNLELPLSGALQLPGGGVFKLGAVNQVAAAKSDGYAYGASGAVSNSGGISLGGSAEFPADATIELSDAALGDVPIPGLPGGGSDATAPALGGVSATIGAISGLAQTKAGGDPVTPKYQIAGLKLNLKSPALGALLGQLAAGGPALQALLDPVVAALGAAGLPVPASCTLSLTTLPPTISLDGGAVVIDPATGALTVDLAKLLDTLGANLNTLPANTDLLGYVLGNLGRILSHGLADVINGIIDPIKDQGAQCVTDITGIPNVGAILGALLTNLTDGQTQLTDALTAIADSLSAAGKPGLKQLTDALGGVAKIGVNVESGPGKAADNTEYPYTSALNATPNQNTPVVANQTLVRAIEIDVLAAAGADPVASLALGNAAAGPSTPGSTPTTPVPTTTTPTNPTDVPTGVPAGQGVPNDSPTLPILLLILGVLMAGGAAATWRLRGGLRGGNHTG